MREYDTLLSHEYEDMRIRFEKMRYTLDEELPDPSIGPPRSPSKCRGRLIDAKRFSEQNYAE